MKEVHKIEKTVAIDDLQKELTNFDLILNSDTEKRALASIVVEVISGYTAGIDTVPALTYLKLSSLYVKHLGCIREVQKEYVQYLNKNFPKIRQEVMRKVIKNGFYLSQIRVVGIYKEAKRTSPDIKKAPITLDLIQKNLMYYDHGYQKLGLFLISRHCKIWRSSSTVQSLLASIKRRFSKEVFPEDYVYHSLLGYILDSIIRYYSPFTFESHRNSLRSDVNYWVFVVADSVLYRRFRDKKQIIKNVNKQVDRFLHYLGYKGRRDFYCSLVPECKDFPETYKMYYSKGKTEARFAIPLRIDTDNRTLDLLFTYRDPFEDNYQLGKMFIQVFNENFAPLNKSIESLL